MSATGKPTVLITGCNRRRQVSRLAGYPVDKFQVSDGAKVKGVLLSIAGKTFRFTVLLWSDVYSYLGHLSGQAL